MWTQLPIVLIAGYAIGGWLHAASLVVLYLIWTQLPDHEGPPVLKLAMSAQWAQVSIGLFYSRLTGEVFDVMQTRAYEKTILMGLGCVLAMTYGLIAGMRAVENRPEPEGPRPDELVSLKSVLVVYAGSVVVTSLLSELSFSLPAIRQVLVVFAMGRLAVVALVMRRLMRPHPQWGWILAMLVFEIGLGFTGYFSGFKEPVFIFGLFMLEIFDWRRTAHWVAIGSAGVALTLALTMWMGVRAEYRRDFDDTLYASSRGARLQRMNGLFTDWLDSRNSKEGSDTYALIDRTWAVYYPSLAVDRVPRILPHTNGSLFGAALIHSVTPRFLFPNKAELINDSDLVRRYSGVWVAGTEEGTTIAFGYAGESYLDFGIPLMFLPAFFYGLAMGAAFSFLLRVISHRELAIALVVCIYWYNLYLYERAWSKFIGTSVAMIIYLGGVAFLVDRYILTEKNRQTQGFVGMPAYPDR